jgi:proline iminopeptidase
MSGEFEVEVAGGTITGWQRGAGPHVLLLHGGPGLSEYTEGLAAELEDGYTVTRYQQRGVAPSTTDGPFDIETQMADAIAVMDEAGIDRAYLLGHSWGGHLALHLAVNHQDRFLGLVPIDPLGGIGDGGAGEMTETMVGRIGPEAALRAQELNIRAVEEGSDADGLEALRLMWPGYFGSPEKVVPMPELRISTSTNNETFASIAAHLQAQTLAQRLPEVALPTVFVLGADSPIRPSHNIATAAVMPNATYRLVDAGHFLWAERPGAVRQALDELSA